MAEAQLSEFLKAFTSRISEARLGETEADEIMPVNPREIALTETFLGDLGDIGQVGDCEVVYFEKRLGRSKGKINAYSISDDGYQVDLVVTLQGSDNAKQRRRIPASEINTAAKNALHFFRSTKQPFHNAMEPASPEYDMVSRLHENYDSVSSIRLIILIEGRVNKFPVLDQPKDLPTVNLDIWDLERLFRAAASGLTYEPISINIEEIVGEPLPCLAAPITSKDHRCYFTIIPGNLLHELYDTHGPRLLELNVRSFLQARGKVNRGIRDTLMEDPGHFLPYNNGISATVEEITLVKNSDGDQAIQIMKGLQIVNGGQTVASIHRAKDRDKVDLSNVYIQAKITQVAPEHVDSLVPHISRFSNTQNKVNETDFSANHPFHIAIQQLSEKTWTPGETTRWFYERARGQWEVARIRGGTTPSQLRTFDQKTPRIQKLDKTLLAKTINACNELPHIVSMGGQKNFVHFMNDLDKMGSTWEPDIHFYKQLIAKVIVFKYAEKIARQIKFEAYRANAVCYTVSMLIYRSAGRVNWDAIWDEQAVSEALDVTLRNWMPQIHEEIRVAAGTKNVTEFCKKPECWARIRSLKLDFALGLENELAAGQALPTVGITIDSNGDQPRDLTTEERDRQARVTRLGPDEWQSIISWMVSTNQFNGLPLQISGTVLGYAASGWKKVPSPKQTKHLIKCIDAWEAQNKMTVID
jgi:hypothetical protein